MLRELTEAERKALDERISHLFASYWIIDNLTALLMKTDPHGLDEDVARFKAHRIIDWLETIGNVMVPATRRH